MIDRGKKNLLGVNIDAMDYQSAVAKIVAAAERGEPCSVSALAVHGLMTGALDKVHRYRLNHLDMVVPDGQPVRWALNLLHGTKLAERVYGPQLMLATCEQAALEGLPIFLFGGSEELLTSLSEKLRGRIPTLQIAGTLASKFRTLQPDEREQMIDTIKSSGAKIVFVGLGCPRQEVFAYELRKDLSLPMLAVGAAFNFHAGQLAQAPPVMQRYGLEWLFRLAAEPRRLWRRYLYLNPLYVAMVVLQAVGIYRVTPEDAVPPQHDICYG